MTSNGIEKGREAVLLSQLNLNHIEAAISDYPYKRFHVKNIRVQLQKSFDIMIDQDGDLERIIGRKVVRAISSLLENGAIRVTDESHGNHGFLYERK